VSSIRALHPEKLPRDREAASRIARVFEEHGRMVYALCRAVLRDADEAEDATQQAFLSAYRALLGGSVVRDEAAWIAAIARNECRTRIAAGMRVPLSIPDDDLGRLAAPRDERERRAQAEAIRRALADLPARQRDAVVPRYLYGLRYGEVATALGLSLPAAEALLFRARCAMRVRLRPLLENARGSRHDRRGDPGVLGCGRRWSGGTGRREARDGGRGDHDGRCRGAAETPSHSSGIEASTEAVLPIVADESRRGPGPGPSGGDGRATTVLAEPSEQGTSGGGRGLARSRSPAGARLGCGRMAGGFQRHGFDLAPSRAVA
jgi:RNA polymerase sigma-70 factor (ECF subfamily)